MKRENGLTEKRQSASINKHLRLAMLCTVLCSAGPRIFAQDRGISVEPIAASAPGGNAGLFVGINQFNQDNSLQPLRFAVNDAIAQAHLFVIELKLVPPANCILVLAGEPTSEDARSQLADLDRAGVKRADPLKSAVLRSLVTVAEIPKDDGDLVVVSISSHGFEDRGVAYAMPSDGLRGFLEDTAVNLSSVEQRLSQSKAGKRLLLVDACRERASPDARGADTPMSAAFRSALAGAEGQAVLASCDAGQLSVENPELEHGVFTYFLVEALHGKAAADERGFITLRSVSDYVAGAVQDFVLRAKPGMERSKAQRPWFKGPRVAEQIPLAVDPGIRARQAAFKTEVMTVVHSLASKINRRGAFNTGLYDRLAEALEQAQDDDAGHRLLLRAQEFIAGKVDEELFVAYVEKTLETSEQQSARLEREANERKDHERQAKIAELLATAQANDSKENGRTALAALDELLGLDPNHAEARLLRAKIAAYYGPTKDAPWENSLGMKFVPVPGTDVLFSIWDTRVQDYQVFVSESRREWPKPKFEQGPTHPAVNVTWEDAKAFCEWLTKKEQGEGRLDSSQSYRLPTDAEWSIAVGLGREHGETPAEKDGKTEGVYPWGNQWPPPHGAGKYRSTANGDENRNTTPVGSFEANGFGLYDMGGNVCQWCEDLYRPSGQERVLRGASWSNHDPDHLLSSRRFSHLPSHRGRSDGFRCVLSVSSPPP
jgi:formylglycine-generating enzyme required for sulfatase activity